MDSHRLWQRLAVYVSPARAANTVIFINKILKYIGLGMAARHNQQATGSLGCALRVRREQRVT